jgi:glycosyl transferase family 25
MIKFPEDIHRVIYINLDKRIDRRAEITAEFKRIGIPEEKIIRCPAIYQSRGKGALGCSQSHVKALKIIDTLPEEIQNILIFEDDFDFVPDAEFVNSSLHQLFERPKEIWDIVLLSFSIKKRQDYDDLLSISLVSCLASGYLINRRVLPKLLKNFEESVKGLQETGREEFYLDAHWNVLMTEGRCFYFNKTLGQQRRSYSDIAYEVLSRPSVN